MTYSKRQLYQAGEPLGESVTAKKLGGGYVCGGGGGSSSSSSSNTTNNVNENLATDRGLAAVITGGSNNISVQSVDKDIANKAMDTVQVSNALSNDGFVKMLGLADKLFTGANTALQSSQATTLAQVAALNTAQNDSKGQIDQKTIAIIAVAAVVGLGFMRGNK